MVSSLRERLGDRPLLWVGHSLGGQVFGLVPGHEHFKALVTVAAGSGYWRDYVPRLRRFAPLLWYVIVPLSILLAGYFPGRTLRMIGDVPAGVMQQWRSWCLDRQYLFGALPARVREHYASLALPLLSLSFADDEYLSERNIQSLHQFYARAERDMQRISPKDIGVPAIGHFGFFRRRFEASLWRRAGDWLDRQVAAVH
jgi:predicted alpha/beta hydrolase